MNTLPAAGAAERPLRIAYVTETWPPEVNGVALTTARFVQGLVQRGHTLQLLRPRQRGEARDRRTRRPIDGHTAAPLTRTGAPAAPGTPVVGGAPVVGGIEEVLTAGVPLPFYPDLRLGLAWPQALARRWRQWRPDVVHLATEGPLAAAALLAARRLGIPLASDFRTNFHAYSAHYGLGRWQGTVLAYLRAFHRRTALTLVPTEALRRDLGTAGFSALSVVARGVDTTLFDPARRDPALRAAWGAGPDDAVLLCVGRLAPEKNLMTLLDAYGALRRRQPRARLVLVGDGPQRAALQARCPQIVFAGARHGADLAAHYASADLFAFPSCTETFGNVVPEALASGLPVVAFDLAAAAQLVQPGVTGHLAAAGDAAAFVRQVVELAESPELRRRMGQAARSAMAEQGWDRVVARFEALLTEVADSAASPQRLLAASARDAA